MRYVSVLALALVWSVMLSGCQQRPKLHQIANLAEGTTYHITWWARHHVDQMKLRREIDAVLTQIDKQISNYQNNSDIEGFNNDQSTGWQSLPPQVINLLNIQRTVYRDSHGCYDPTISPLFDLWGFRKGKMHVPSAAAIAAVKREIGFDHIQLDVAHNRLRKNLPKLRIDMSSVGEGYSIWRLAHVLEHNGIHNYIVEFGGDMLVKGHKPGNVKWRIAIAKPIPGELTPDVIATIEDEGGVSLNTSGTYRQFFDAKGKTYSHILDPRTGRPVTHHLVSATVFYTDPRVGDAWATAMLCLGKREGDAVAKKFGLKVFFVQHEGTKLINSESPALRASKMVKIH